MAYVILNNKQMIPMNFKLNICKEIEFNLMHVKLQNLNQYVFDVFKKYIPPGGMQ